MTPEQWLSEQINSKGIKQAFIVEKAGIPKFTTQKLSACLTGRRNIQAYEFIGVCRAIGVNPLDFPIPSEAEVNA